MTSAPVGRPLWALGLLLLGWSLVRAMVHTPALEWAMPVAYAESATMRGAILARDAAPPLRLIAAGTRFPLPESTVGPSQKTASSQLDRLARKAFVFTIPAENEMPPSHDPSGTVGSLPPPAPVSRPATTALATTSRWAVDGWVLWRQGSSRAALARSGQLGGAQAGVRVAYELLPHSSSKLALYARLTGALRDPVAPEGALGLAVQPIRTIPIVLGIERRIALGSGARDAFALLAAGGFGPVLLAPGLWAEGYGQAGMVGFRRRDAFADGRLSLLHELGGDRFAVGATVSGGAQPHLSRLDIGPSAQARFPLARKPVRLTVEWRQRIAGRARPGSGPAVTLATSF